MVIQTAVTSYSTNLHIQHQCAWEHHLRWLFLDRITFHIHTFILRKIICGLKFMKELEYFVTVLNLMNLEPFLHARMHAHTCIWLSYTWKWHEHVKNILETNINPLTPNDYSGRTVPLTSKCCILYIYSTNIGTEHFKHGLYSPFFSSSKCSVFHKSNVFGSCIFNILYTGCAKI